MRPGRNHSPAFKAKMPLAAVKGLSGFLCGRPLSSSDDEPLAEDDGELSFCLRPFAGWTFPLLSGGVEHEV